MNRRSTRLAAAASAAVLALGLFAGTALAGEITGNGKLLDMHARSECAFSGQEDLQWYLDDGNTQPRPPATIVKGEPANAQSWGQIPKSAPVGEISRDFLTSVGAHPGMACNPSGARGEH